MGSVGDHAKRCFTWGQRRSPLAVRVSVCVCVRERERERERERKPETAESEGREAASKQCLEWCGAFGCFSETRFSYGSGFWRPGNFSLSLHVGLCDT
jgi:hypothetical protein